MPTTIAFAVAGQWFDKQKGIAMGCVTLGAPLGGIFFTLVLQTLFDKYPWQTAALVLVAVLATFLLLGIHTNRHRLLPFKGCVTKGRQQARNTTSTGRSSRSRDPPSFGSSIIPFSVSHPA